jgi:hypothetical protein
LKKIEIKLREGLRNNNLKKNVTSQNSLETIRKKLSYENTVNSYSSVDELSNVEVFDENVHVNDYMNYDSARFNQLQNSNKHDFVNSSRSHAGYGERKYLLNDTNNLTRSNQVENFTMSNRSDDGLDTSVKRVKNFNEIELDNVRSRLQQRINDLEPLPELLKTTEAKLHESTLKLKKIEVENYEYKNLVAKLKTKLDLAEKENSLGKVERKRIKEISSISKSPRNTVKIAEKETKQRPDTMDTNKIKNYQDEIKGLIKLLGMKEDVIRDLTTKLSTKANETASLSRQLDLALSDSGVKEQELRGRSLAKVKFYTI